MIRSPPQPTWNITQDLLIFLSGENKSLDYISRSNSMDVFDRRFLSERVSETKVTLICGQPLEHTTVPWSACCMGRRCSRGMSGVGILIQDGKSWKVCMTKNSELHNHENQIFKH